MYISRHNIGNLYDNILLKEMDERIVSYLWDHVEDLPFANIFGDNFRIYVPIHKDPTAKEILDTLKRIRDYEGLDLQKGEVVRKIKLDPKYGGGEKEQRMNIGSAISKLKIGAEEKKKYLDWLARYKDNMVESLGEQKYGIIISRAPIDVLRMSDFSGMSSCHTQPGKFGQEGQFFQCAVQEAINGGGVAFVVDNEEFNNVLEQGYTLNDEEFFSDDDRDISEEFEPISRLRIRRLMGEKGTDFAIPDTKIYGDQTIPGFLDTVKNFLKEKQPVKFEEFKQQQWLKRGGTYYDGGDHAINDLVRNYFGGTASYDISLNIGHNRYDKGDESRRTSEVKNLTHNLEEECEDMTNSYNGRMNFSQVGCSVQDDGDDPYIMAWGQTEFGVSHWGVPELDEINFAIENDRDDIKKALRGDYDDGIEWSGLLNWIENQSGLELGGFEFYNGHITLTYYSEETFFRVDEYVTFCDNIKDYDRLLSREFQDPNDWIPIFEEVGIIKNQENESALNKLISSIPEDDLVYDDTRGDRNVELSVVLDAIKEESFEKYIDPSSTYNNIPYIKDNNHIGDLFASMLDKYIGIYYRVTPSNTHQQEFKNFVEAYYQTRLTGGNNITKYGVDRIHVEFDPNEYNVNSGNRTIIMNIKFDVETFTEENVDLIIFLHNNLNDLKNMATLAYLAENRYIITGSARYKNQFNALKRVYGKLM